MRLVCCCLGFLLCFVLLLAEKEFIGRQLIAKIINRKSAEPSLEMGRNQGSLAGRDTGKTNRN